MAIGLFLSGVLANPMSVSHFGGGSIRLTGFHACPHHGYLERRTLLKLGVFTSYWVCRHGYADYLYVLIEFFNTSYDFGHCPLG